MSLDFSTYVTARDTYISANGYKDVFLYGLVLAKEAFEIEKSFISTMENQKNFDKKKEEDKKFFEEGNLAAEVRDYFLYLDIIIQKIEQLLKQMEHEQESTSKVKDSIVEDSSITPKDASKQDSLQEESKSEVADIINIDELISSIKERFIAFIETKKDELAEIKTKVAPDIKKFADIAAATISSISSGSIVISDSIKTKLKAAESDPDLDKHFSSNSPEYRAAKQAKADEKELAAALYHHAEASPAKLALMGIGKDAYEAARQSRGPEAAATEVSNVMDNKAALNAQIIAGFQLRRTGRLEKENLRGAIKSANEKQGGIQQFRKSVNEVQKSTQGITLEVLEAGYKNDRAVAKLTNFKESLQRMHTSPSPDTKQRATLLAAEFRKFATELSVSQPEASVRSRQPK